MSDTVGADNNGVATQQLVDAVQLAVTHLTQDNSSGGGEPSAKRARTDSECDVSLDQSVKQILFNINRAVCLRLDGIESKLETVCLRTKYLEEKMDQLVNAIKQNSGIVSNTPLKRPRIITRENSDVGDPLTSTPQLSGSSTPMRRSSAVIVGLPQGNISGSTQSSEGGDVDQTNNSMSNIDQTIQNLGPNVTLITLNTEEDFPTGTWLGDDSNPEMRVRVPVTPSDLLHIHSNCRTPEKMALTLLDYLFDRETQASSNLSGMGKHGKKQLDPLMIYGIRCHLIHKFGITEQDWHRIKQNIDSKCRTAWRRKQRGMPLTVKAFRGKAPPTYIHLEHGQEMSSHSDDSMQHEDSELHIHQGDVELPQGATPVAIHAHPGASLLQHGEIQVLHATPEQMAQLQQAQHIQILQGDQVLEHLGDNPDGMRVAVSLAGGTQGIQLVTSNVESGGINPEDLQDGDEVAVSMQQQEGVQVITDTGEAVQITAMQAEQEDISKIDEQQEDS